jgi:transcriptional regulator with XRE-family HTH domain/Zn-dependent peptidase ImmA (M78 family)
MSTNLIGSRIKALRARQKLSQDDLARLFGFKDRQTVSAIESGERRVSADELLLLVEKLDVPLDYFMDPFRLDGEGRFSWRQTGLPEERLSAYERTAGRWIAAFRRIAPEVGHDIPLLRHSLGLTRQNSFEDAAEAGERFAAEFALGEVPANVLPKVVEERLGLLVLMVNAIEGISGAACRLPELDAVLINRREVPGRRHFDLAHELFHILTWDAMTPEHVEPPTETGGNRVEQLANNFASALLMPAALLDRRDDWSSLNRDELIKKLNTVGDELRVTASALKWRLVGLRRIARAQAEEIPDTALRNNGRGVASVGATPRLSKKGIGAEFVQALLDVNVDPPPLFSKPFAEVMARALDQGRISARKASDLLDLTIDDLPQLFREHGIGASVDL